MEEQCELLAITQYEAMVMLDLQEAEREQLGERAEDLASGFDELEQIETDGTEPLVTVLDAQNVMRDDIAEKLLSRDEILANAPEQQDGYFQVPGTLD